MKKKFSPSPRTDDLRSEAEAKLKERRMSGSVHPETESDIRRLAGELQVHQIELQMQNEELMRIQGELETSRAKYFDLFDLAPVGYLSLDDTGIILEANLTAANMLGVARSRLVKKPLIHFVVREDQDIYNRHCKALCDTHAQQVCELRMTGKDGIPFWVYVESIAAQDHNDTPVYHTTLSDITEQKHVEGKLRSLLKEKEVLAREVHHRVKNNFLIISSLLGLQSQEIKDEYIKEMFIKSRDRIKSMALIHERLYQSKDMTCINFAEFIKTLAADLFQAYGTDPEKVSMITEVEDFFLSVDKAIPCGLIVNELISNALKYGFPEIRTGKGQIKMTLRNNDKNEIEMTVTDNGVGLPEDFDIHKTKSLGLRLVMMLTEDQLGGILKVDGKSGAKFQIIFSPHPSGE